MPPAPNPALMRRAIALATENVRTGRGGPFGAVIAAGDLILGEGANSVTRDNDPTAHAEILAIRAACGSRASFALRGCQIYASCEPCPMCLAAIYWARIDRIWFAATSADAACIAFDDAFLYRELAQPAPARSIPSSMLLRDEALQSFQLWLSSPSRIPY